MYWNYPGKLCISTSQAITHSTKRGFGLIPEQSTVTNKNSDYIYWDNVNELVNRLQLLI